MSAPETERWQRLKEMFVALSGEPAHARLARAEAWCGADRDLLDELMGLLAAHENAAREDWWPLASEPRTARELFADNERFELLERLGVGGHGEVFRARDRDTGGIVALKVLRRSQGDDLLRFKREFRTLADRHHPGLVRVFELFVAPPHTFFTMEFVDGVPLTAAWASWVPARVRERSSEIALADQIREAFAKLAGVLEHLHAEGFIHRDLKPSNVLRTPDGRVVVLDFGLVTDAPASQDQTGREWGTPRFMAPEVRAGKPASRASDWFAVGLMLEEVLRGISARSSHEAALAERAEPQAPQPSASFDRLARLSAALREPDPSRRPSGAEVVALLAFRDARESEPAVVQRAVSGESAFVGREAEIAALERAWCAVGPGRPLMVSIEGPSGVGKTALARHFLERVRGRDARAVVLQGRCHDRETLGFRAFDGVLDSLNVWMRREREDEVRDFLPRDVHELVTLFPVLGAVPAVQGARRRVFHEEDAIQRRQRAFSALRELLGRIACQRPLVLFIDDFQWADRDSLALLSHVLRGTEAPPCLLLATRRCDAPESRAESGEPAPSSDPLLQARVIALAPLSPSESLAMSAEALGSQGSLAQLVAQECGGMPFLVTLFVDELSRAPLAAIDTDGGTNFGERLVRAALARLTDAARGVLETLAVASRPLPRELAARLAGVDAATLYEAEVLLRARHLTRQSADGQLEPYHDRVREAVIASLDPAARVGWHTRIAERLASHDHLDAAEIAHHFRYAGRAHEAAHWALAAAREASRALAFERAVRLYELAVESRDAQGVDTELLLEWAEALDRAGRCREAAATYLRAAERDVAHQLSLKARAGDALLRAGDTGTGRALLGEAVTAYGWRVPRSRAGRAAFALWFKLRAWGVALLLTSRVSRREVSKRTKHLLQASWALASSLALVDTLGAAYFQARHQHLAMVARSPAHMARALGLGAVFAAIHGSRKRARVERYFAAFDRLAARLPDPTIAAMRPVFHAVVAWLAGNWAECQRHALEADELLGARRLAVSWEQGTNRAFLLASLLWLGQLAEHRRLLGLFLEDARTRGDIHSETSLLLLAHQHLIHLADDEPAKVAAVLGSLERWSSGGTYPIQFIWRTYAEVETALYTGDPYRAWSIWMTEWARVGSSVHMRLQTMRIFCHHLGGRVALAMASIRQGQERTKLLAAATRSAARLDSEQTPWGLGFAECLRVGIARLSTGQLSSSALEVAEAALRRGNLILYADLLRDLARRRGFDWSYAALGGPMRSSGVLRDVVAPNRLARALLPGIFEQLAP